MFMMEISIIVSSWVLYLPAGEVVEMSDWADSALCVLHHDNVAGHGGVTAENFNLNRQVGLFLFGYFWPLNLEEYINNC